MPNSKLRSATEDMSASEWNEKQAFDADYIQEFCVPHRISAAFYYALKKAGLGPREMVLGRRRIISNEAAADWRRERTAAEETAKPISE